MFVTHSNITCVSCGCIYIFKVFYCFKITAECFRFPQRYISVCPISNSILEMLAGSGI